MARPTVTGFEAKADLGNGVKGLKSKNNSTSPVVLNGTNLATSGMTVNVSNGAGVSWSGDLYQEASVWRAELKCTNNSTGMGDSEEVTVTVTGQDGTSPNYNTTTNIAPGG